MLLDESASSRRQSQKQATEEERTNAPSPMLSPVFPPTQPQAKTRTQQSVRKVPETVSDAFVTQSAQSLIAGSQMQPVITEDNDETMFEPEESRANNRTAKTVGQLQSGLDADDGNFSMKDLEKATNYISQSSKKRKTAATTSKSSVTKSKRGRAARNAKRFSI